MIRVNLLPVKELMAATRRRRELTIGGLVLGVGLLIIVGLFSQQYYQISSLNSELAGLRSDIQALNTKVKQVGELQNRIKEFTGKHNVISGLNKKKSGPVGVMESLSAATPARLWLTEFKEIGGRLTINGLAADNQTVADFLKALAAFPYFREVELIETTQGGQEVGPYKKFSIKSVVYYLPQPAAVDKAGTMKIPAKEEKRG
jgi:type IV pilus assembly protein PilN